jgi:hypothetical protein
LDVSHEVREQNGQVFNRAKRGTGSEVGVEFGVSGGSAVIMTILVKVIVSVEVIQRQAVAVRAVAVAVKVVVAASHPHHTVI